MLRFVNWLDNIKRESGPSLWESLASYELPADTAGIADTPFTQEELATIRVRLDEMARRVEMLQGLTQEQKLIFREEFRRIGNTAPRVGRALWLRAAFGGLLLQILLTSDIQKTVAANLMQWAVSAFHNIATGAPLPPLLLPP